MLAGLEMKSSLFIFSYICKKCVLLCAIQQLSHKLPSSSPEELALMYSSFKNGCHIKFSQISDWKIEGFHFIWPSAEVSFGKTLSPTVLLMIWLAPCLAAPPPLVCECGRTGLWLQSGFGLNQGRKALRPCTQLSLPVNTGCLQSKNGQTCMRHPGSPMEISKSQTAWWTWRVKMFMHIYLRTCCKWQVVAKTYTTCTGKWGSSRWDTGMLYGFFFYSTAPNPAHKW